jgi:L,D-transpeptidase catalytic domain/Putative peptidoglycan binding domain
VKHAAASFVRMSLWKRALLSLFVVLAGAVAIAPSAGPPRTIEVGVRVAGVNFGGLDAGQARQQIIERYSAPLRLRLGKQRFSVSTSRLGLRVAVNDAVSQALQAETGDDIDVRVRFDRKEVRSYVGALDERFGIAAENAEVVGLVDGHPAISASRWGRAVRRGTMYRAIGRLLQTRIRPVLPVVLKPLKPAISKARFGPVIVIRRGSNRLDFYAGERHVRAFRVATGRSQYPTPTGTWRIVEKQQNPWWRPPDSDWARGLKPIPPGPGNPLGTRWMGLSAPGVGIHGTPDAASIGYSASHGCIRMFIPDATWLFDHVRIGTPVLIVD